MTKLDLRKELKYLYSPSAKKVEAVKVPRFQFAMVDGMIEKGQGPSSSPQFAEALEALYGISYTLKFMCKLRKDKPIDYPVMALEGLWWIENGEFDIREPDNWLFTVMILQPDFITQKMFKEALEQLRKKRGDSPAINKLRLEKFAEGLTMQTMHIGPYATEPETVERLKAFAEENGYRDRVGAGGKHHEIYMGDPRRAKPEKLKTILRHPIEKAR
jgi:hypothetical protein